MRSTIQANRGQASILQGLPAETPETPVLISKIFNFSHFPFGITSFKKTCADYDEIILNKSPSYRRILASGKGILCKSGVISDLVQIASVHFRHYSLE
jgi:hypothetical protein